MVGGTSFNSLASSRVEVEVDLVLSRVGSPHSDSFFFIMYILFFEKKLLKGLQAKK